MGVAPAPTRAILGPCSTQGGFQYWYLACFPDGIVAVRQGIWAGLLLAMSGTVVPARLGILGVIAGTLLQGSGEKRRRQVEAALAKSTATGLRRQPNLSYPVSQLRAITFKTNSFGTLITPSIILETSNGKKEKFGIQKPDFEKAVPLLKHMFPTLCRE